MRKRSAEQYAPRVFEETNCFSYQSCIQGTWGMRLQSNNSACPYRIWAPHTLTCFCFTILAAFQLSAVTATLMDHGKKARRLWRSYMMSSKSGQSVSVTSTKRSFKS